MAEPGNQDNLLHILEPRVIEREPFNADDFQSAPAVIRTQGLRMRLDDVAREDEQQYPEPKWREDIEAEREAERRRQQEHDDQPHDGGGRLSDLAPHVLAGEKGFDDRVLERISIAYDPTSLRSMARAAGSVLPSFTSLLADRLVHGRPLSDDQVAAIALTPPLLPSGPISWRALSGLPDGPIIPPIVTTKCLDAADAVVGHKPQLLWSTAAVTAVAVALSASPNIPKEPAKAQPVILDANKPIEPADVRPVRAEARYVVSSPVPLRTVALDLNVPISELQSANPGLTNKTALPAGTIVNTTVESTRVALPEPVSVADLAAQYGVSEDAIAAVNEVDEQGIIGNAVNVPGLEVIPVSDQPIDLEAVALHLGLSDVGAKELRRVNAAAPDGQLIVPRYQSITDKLVDTSQIAAVATGEVAPTPLSTTVSNSDQTVASSGISDDVTHQEPAVETATTQPDLVAPTTTVADESTGTPPATAPVPEVNPQPAMVERPATPEEKFAADIEAVRQALDTAWRTGDMGPLNHVVHYSPIFKGYQLSSAQQEDGLRSLPPANLLNIPGLLYEVSTNTPANERIANSYAISGILFAAYSLRQEIMANPMWTSQYANACIKVGDLTAKDGHKTHNAGTDVDMNSVMQCDIVSGHATADGPVAWVNRSGPISFKVANPAYNAELDKRLLLHMTSLQVNGEKVVSGILYNGPNIAINGVRPFPNHGDHQHYDFAGPRDGSFESHAQGGGRPEQHLDDLYQMLWLSYAAGQGVPGISQTLMIRVPATSVTPASVPVVSVEAPSIPNPEQPVATALEVAPVVESNPAKVPEGAPDDGPTPAEEYDFVFALLLNEIASGEAKVDEWNAINHGSSGDAHGNYTLRDGRKVSDLTLAEVMWRQNLPKGNPDYLFAVGRYQIIPKTMRSLVSSLNIDVNQQFSPELQNLLAAGLIFEKRPNVADFIKGDDSKMYLAVEDLCREWASVPCNDGTGHYDGDSAGNGASGGRERVRQIRQLLEATREKYNAALAYMLRTAAGQEGVK